MSSIKKWEIWQKFRDFGLFLYNRKEGTFLGRKPSFWGKMLAFYLFFTSIIFSIFYITLGFTNETLKSSYPNSPMFDKYDLLPDPSPGLSLYPTLTAHRTPLIWYGTFLSGFNKHTKEKYHISEYTDFVHAIDEFLQPYIDAEKDSDFGDCSKDTSKVCIFKTSQLGDCGVGDYGYRNNSPCIFMKINKMPTWKPVPFKSSDIEEKMPQRLQDLIRTNEEVLWLDCEPDNGYSADHFESIEYYPSGFPAYYFPYNPENRHKYLSPLVAVKIKNINRKFVLSITCKLWAKNIAEDAREKQSLNFIVYVD